MGKTYKAPSLSFLLTWEGLDGDDNKKDPVMPLCGSILQQSPGIFNAVSPNYQFGRSLDLGRECSPLGAMTIIFSHYLTNRRFRQKTVTIYK